MSTRKEVEDVVRQVAKHELREQMNGYLHQLFQLLIASWACTQEFADSFLEVDFAVSDPQGIRMSFICENGHYLLVELINDGESFSFETSTGGDDAQKGLCTEHAKTGLNLKELFSKLSHVLLQNKILNEASVTKHVHS